MIDKLFRIANKKDAFDENPWRDIAGYALLSTISAEPYRESEGTVENPSDIEAHNLWINKASYVEVTDFRKKHWFTLSAKARRYLDNALKDLAKNKGKE